MTIFVFTDLGGDNLLGKARELADASGDKVVAFTSKNSSEDTQHLIYLGADEVLSCETRNLNEWASVICDMRQTDENSKMILFPSNLFSNDLTGMIYSRGAGKFAPLLDQADLIDEDFAGKIFAPYRMAIRKKFVPGQVTLCSLRTSSVPSPFEDTSRFGKTRTIKSSIGLEKDSLPSSEFLSPSSSDVLTVLIGRNVGSSIQELANMIARKYGGRAKKNSSKIEVVYGACIAIEIDTRLRDLPEFQRDLISISKSPLPISSISDSSVITDDLEAVLQNLVAG